MLATRESRDDMTTDKRLKRRQTERQTKRESIDNRRHNDRKENQETIDGTATNRRYSRGDRRHGDQYEENMNRQKAQIEKIFEETTANLEKYRSGTEAIRRNELN